MAKKRRKPAAVSSGEVPSDASSEDAGVEDKDEADDIRSDEGDAAKVLRAASADKPAQPPAKQKRGKKRTGREDKENATPELARRAAVEPFQQGPSRLRIAPSPQ